MSVELDLRTPQEQPQDRRVGQADLQLKAGLRKASLRRMKSGLLRRFRADRKGATAVEFGLLALPFFFLMMMIVEMAMVFWQRQVLQEATSQAARSILTGRSRVLYTGSEAAQTEAFRKAICAKIYLSSGCSTRVFIDVQPLGPSFPASRAMSMVREWTIDPTSFVMRSVGPEQVAIVRVAYKVPVITAGFFGSLARLNTCLLYTSDAADE